MYHLAIRWVPANASSTGFEEKDIGRGETVKSATFRSGTFAGCLHILP